MDTLASRLKELRKEKGLTLEQIARDLSTTSMTISRYENGLREPKGDMLNSLANYFNVSIDYLFGRTSERYSISKKEKLDVKKALDELLKDFEDNESLMFDGEPMDKNEFDSFIQSLEVVFTIAKKKHEEKLQK